MIEEAFKIREKNMPLYEERMVLIMAWKITKLIISGVTFIGLTVLGADKIVNIVKGN